jgi:hypothetical protein
MKQTFLIILITFGLSESLIAQKAQLPDRISITDKFFSPWGTNLFYEYELERNGECYTIQRTAYEENGKKKNRKKHIGSIDEGLIEKILTEILKKTSTEIDPKDFQGYFPMDSIDMFLKNHGDNYWINNEYQRQFIKEQLTNPDNLKNNLELYFKNYDHSGYIDGSSTEVEIKFHFRDSILVINSKSILWFGLPIEMNKRKNFSPILATWIGELIPESETKRKEQFSGEELFSALIRETINNHREKIANLESKTYQVYIDSLESVFTVSLSSINGSFSYCWNGERRYTCLLSDSTMPKNLSIAYSNPIENGKLKYPVSKIINEYNQLLKLYSKANYLQEFQTSNPDCNYRIRYDGNGNFTKKGLINIQKNGSEFLPDKNDYNSSLFIEIYCENFNYSRWIMLANGNCFEL